MNIIPIVIRKKADERKMRIHLPNCKAHGPGLVSPGMQNIRAPFTIEARNIDDQIIHCGGHNFRVSIIGTSSDTIPLKFIDNEDGTYSVEYIPTFPGKYIIGIALDDQSITGSPFEVNVLKFRTAPVPQWYHLDGKKWIPFAPTFSQEIEQVWQILNEHSMGSGKSSIIYEGTNYPIDYIKMNIKEKKK